MRWKSARPASPPGRDSLVERMLAFMDAVPYRWALIYAVIAGVGGWLSDWYMSEMQIPRHLYLFAMVKNGGFVLLTAGLLYLLLRREVRVLQTINRTLQEERVFNQALLQSLSEGIVATARDGSVCVFNRAAKELLGSPEALVEGREGRFFKADGVTPLNPPDGPMARARRGETVHELEMVLRSPGAPPRVLLAHAGPIRLADGQLLGAVVGLLDVTEMKFYVHKAFHDPLTELPNRALLLDRLTQALRSLERRPRTLALLFLDLDEFKPVNDLRGHGVGDQVLVEVGVRLSECLRPEDTLARMGGDEFILLLDEIENSMAALKVAHRVAELIARPFLIEGEEIRISASVGVALTRAPMAPSRFLHQADLAMYSAKRSPTKGRCELFLAEVHGEPESPGEVP
ncbi:MAG: sensor domain-containing diguanylate cyclase [Acidobacteria bacterium]|nr:sensor domain-containing diguanylate cyclase [Acidobacteriota bacterium]